ncbi:rab-GTPase-TBC domain-containing protein, partial [Ephemerocybe angulata]
STPSLVPSLGEDLDAFHVRNTYAQLEVSGVKGDGYEEGVERTRAARTRVASANSQVLADAAVADENEKKRELDPKEIQILSSLDRYGFFTVPSHDRLFSMPSQPFLKPLPFSPSAAASAGPPSPSAPSSPTPSASGNVSASPRTLSALPPVITPGKENARIAKWGRMLIPHERDEGGNVQAWRIRPSKVNKLRRRTYKGIPDRWRAAAWEVLMTAYSSGGGVREVRQTEREYRDNLEKPSSYDIQIDLDVPRTISGHIMFRTRYGAGQRSLFHVLHAFSLRCETCGYVQGMGPITSTLLSYMSPSLAYTSLVRLHDAYSLHTVFSPGFPGLLEAIYVQERLTQVAMPGVYAAFQKNMISTTSYATKWYITLFANSVPFQTQLRLWDVFLLEGYDIYIAVAVAIVWVYRDHITSAAANFETVLSLLSGFFVPEDENVLLGWLEKMLGDKRIRSAMRGWRMEWRELVRQGKEGTALL